MAGPLVAAGTAPDCPSGWLTPGAQAVSNEITVIKTIDFVNILFLLSFQRMGAQRLAQENGF
jgi:hypothetical protein